MGHVSIFGILCFSAILSITQAFQCKNRHCSFTKNENNEVVFDCSSDSENNSTIVTCMYIETKNKLIISTSNEKYFPIDKISPGAFSRLVSRIVVDKLYINKLQFKTLRQDDFDGLLNISELRIENPKTLASDSFLKLATKTKFFILTISCVEGNSENSFESLYLMSDKWRILTQNCYKQLTCEYSNCDTKTHRTMSKISFLSTPVGYQYQIVFQSCALSPRCINSPVTMAPVTMRPSTKVIPTFSIKKVPEVTIIKEYRHDDYYDSMMYIVLILTSINSFVILGILVFLVSWFNRLSTSNTNKKHTIVLNDEDDSKFLKSAPFA